MRDFCSHDVYAIRIYIFLKYSIQSYSKLLEQWIPVKQNCECWLILILSVAYRIIFIRWAYIHFIVIFQSIFSLKLNIDHSKTIIISYNKYFIKFIIILTKLKVNWHFLWIQLYNWILHLLINHIICCTINTVLYRFRGGTKMLKKQNKVFQRKNKKENKFSH